MEHFVYAAVEDIVAYYNSSPPTTTTGVKTEQSNLVLPLFVGSYNSQVPPEKNTGSRPSSTLVKIEDKSFQLCSLNQLAKAFPFLPVQFRDFIRFLMTCNTSLLISFKQAFCCPGLSFWIHVLEKQQQKVSSTSDSCWNITKTEMIQNSNYGKLIEHCFIHITILSAPDWHGWL